MDSCCFYYCRPNPSSCRLCTIASLFKMLENLSASWTDYSNGPFSLPRLIKYKMQETSTFIKLMDHFTTLMPCSFVSSRSFISTKVKLGCRALTHWKIILQLQKKEEGLKWVHPGIHMWWSVCSSLLLHCTGPVSLPLLLFSISDSCLARPEHLTSSSTCLPLIWSFWQFAWSLVLTFACLTCENPFFPLTVSAPVLYSHLPLIH